MYAVTVMFDLNPGQVQAFLPLMLENARTSREAEEGCLQFDVLPAGDSIFLYEIYTDRAAFDVHLASTHFQRFSAQTESMIASKQITTFDEVLR